MAPDVAGNAMTRHAPNAAADFLDGAHEWKGKEHRPEHPKAKLRADLGIGGNSTRIIIGGARHKSGTQRGENLLDAG